MSELNLDVFLYGRNGTLVEIELRPAIPTKVAADFDALKSWIFCYDLSMNTDIKHSQMWDCEICGKPARETVVHENTWLDPPKQILYLHCICDVDCKPCMAGIQNIGTTMGFSATPPPSLVKPRTQPVFPRFSSCAKCKREETGVLEFSMNRCSKCHLTRYCGVECQGADWSRHKKICKNIKSVKWTNWD